MKATVSKPVGMIKFINGNGDGRNQGLEVRFSFFSVISYRLGIMTETLVQRPITRDLPETGIVHFSRDIPYFNIYFPSRLFSSLIQNLHFVTQRRLPREIHRVSHANTNM